MSVVKGKNVIFKLTEGLIACGRSCTLTTSTTLIETTTAGSGKTSTWVPQKNNITGSLEGVVFLNEAGKVTLPYLRKYQLKHTLCTGSFERTAKDGDIYMDEFDFWITNITDTGAVGDFNTFQMDIQVNGDPVGSIGQLDYLLDNATGLPILDNVTGKPILIEQLSILY